jgi:quinol monooxygenase YgiN
MFITMVFHHPKPEHREQFLQFMHTIEEGMAGTPGLVSIESFQDLDANRLVAIGRWESREAATAGIPRLLAIGGRDPAWSAKDDELFRLQG